MYTTSLVDIRKEIIKQFVEAEDKNNFIEKNAETLFSLDLTMLSDDYSLNSLFYNALALSRIDEKISLHPEQARALKELEAHQGMILSAPTSFGKTFIVFEYIARHLPKTVFLVVPTLALVEEYKTKILKKYSKTFSRYKIYTNIKNEEYNDEYILFIVTHDRVLEETSFDRIKSIDFLVIDEVYKLDRKSTDDRKLILNFAYFFLVQKSEKHLLLAPFISGIDNINKLQKQPVFFKSNFSPVVNEVITKKIFIDKLIERFRETKSILSIIPKEEKNLVYFSNASDIPKFIDNYEQKEDDLIIEEKIAQFITWAEKEIHPQWYVVKAMKKGLLIHSGDLQLGIRNIQLDFFENESISNFNTMLCTSTLLEGVNTSTNNIIITKPSRGYSNSFNNEFEAFDFFNLVGRSGRLFKTFLGKAYYIKGPEDKDYSEAEAIKNIEFEITSNSIDVKIQKNECYDVEFTDFLKTLNCTREEYLVAVGYTRLAKVKELYESYIKNRNNLIKNIEKLLNDKEHNYSKKEVIYQIILILMNKEDYDKFSDFRATIVNKIINKRRLSVKEIVDDIYTNCNFTKDLNKIITYVIKNKNSYIEYDFYKNLKIILFFMEKENLQFKYINYIKDNIINNIDFIYYKNEPIKKILKETGIYDRDIEIVFQYVKDLSDDVKTIRDTLLVNKNSYFDKISYISKYAISRL